MKKADWANEAVAEVNAPYNGASSTIARADAVKLLRAERRRTLRVIRQWAQDESLMVTVKTLLRRLR